MNNLSPFDKFVKALLSNFNTSCVQPYGEKIVISVTGEHETKKIYFDCDYAIWKVVEPKDGAR